MPNCQLEMSVDKAIELVASTHRRRLLRCLLEEPGSHFERGELAAHLYREDELGLDSLELALAHQHLPKLADTGVIEYDSRSGAVRLTETIESIKPLLEVCEDWEA